ncbi:transposase [Halomonas daqiaonensis]|uniref:Transposase n=1 Tax=Halomonas daqiaonensis TaxID=650850 RepID=A0A1H7UWE2_9GAMM|nr:transposase [Halomonas daqiaonensis]
MARQPASMKKTRTRYSQDYKAEALALADRVGISAAARELGLQPSQLYQWRTKAQQRQSTSEREQALADENARLKRQLAEKSEELEIAKKAAVYFAKSLK